MIAETEPYARGVLCFVFLTTEMGQVQSPPVRWQKDTGVAGLKSCHLWKHPTSSEERREERV